MYLEQAGHHLMGQNHRFEFAFGLALIAVLPGQHIHLPLVQAQLADVCLHHALA